jgi:hypothetical protein
VKGTTATTDWTVPLTPGTHHFTVVANSPDSTSQSIEMEVFARGARGLGNHKIHSLCVGVAQYAHNNDGKKENRDINLKYSADDARVMDDLVNHRCAEKLFSPGRSVLLTNRYATAPSILAAIKQMSTGVDSGDLFLVHFSCHGERDESGQLYLLTHEVDRTDLKNTALSGEKLKDALAEIPCRVLLLLDACHSSAIGPPHRVANDMAMLLSQEDCGVAVIAAARTREFALERIMDPVTNKEIPNGIFTWSIKRGLEGAASPDPYDGRVYIHDLYQYIFREVRHLSQGRQFPYMNSPFGAKPVPLVYFGIPAANGPK